MTMNDRLQTIVWRSVEMVPTTTRHPLQVSLEGVISVGQVTCFDAIELAALDGQKLDGKVAVLA